MGEASEDGRATRDGMHGIELEYREKVALLQVKLRLAESEVDDSKQVLDNLQQKCAALEQESIAAEAALAETSLT